MDSSVDVCDLMINLLCTSCSDRACAESDDEVDHSKLMNCIRKDFREATAVGIHAVDDEGGKHYEEVTIDDTKEFGRWTQTVTKIEILRKERT